MVPETSTSGSHFTGTPSTGVIQPLTLWEPNQKTWPGWELNTATPLELHISEVADSKTLEVAIQESRKGLQSPRVFSVTDIFEVPNHRDLETKYKCSQGLAAPAPDVFGHLVWEIGSTTTEEGGDTADISCQECSNLPSRHSLIVVVKNHESNTEFNIHKTSCRYWDQLNFNFDQLYAGFAFKFDRYRDVQVKIAQASDCPKCITTCVATLVYRYVALGSLIFSQIMSLNFLQIKKYSFRAVHGCLSRSHHRPTPQSESSHDGVQV